MSRLIQMRRRQSNLSSITWGTRRRNMGSITWGTRARGLGSVLDTHTPIVSPMLDPGFRVVTMGPIPQEPPPPIPFPGNPDTQPGAWPGLSPGGLTFTPSPFISGGCIIGADGKSVCTQLQPLPPPTTNANGSPGTVVVTPTSGPIPSPGTVAAGTAAPASWLDQSLIGGIPNKFLLLGGIGAFFLFGGKGK